MGHDSSSMSTFLFFVVVFVLVEGLTSCMSDSDTTVRVALGFLSSFLLSSFVFIDSSSSLSPASMAIAGFSSRFPRATLSSMVGAADTDTFCGSSNELSSSPSLSSTSVASSCSSEPSKSVMEMSVSVALLFFGAKTNDETHLDSLAQSLAKTLPPVS